MAKSARSSQIKTNNQKLKKNVFGPVEEARTARLSARLLELASQPKPQKDVEMQVVEGDETKTETAEKTAEEAMEVDSGSKAVSKRKSGRIAKSGIAKRKLRKSAIVFPKYGEKKNMVRKKK
ncbi:Protein of unknown function (DUF2423) domain containing protein [Rhypophila sp. PSN 637]